MKLRWQAHTAYVIGSYEPEFINALRRHVRPGDTCVDVGGNMGYYCMVMARLTGSKGRVITFEPIAENQAVLRENIALNGMKNVEVADIALGASPGVMSLIRGEAGAVTATPSVKGYAVEGTQSSVEVRVDALDAFLEYRSCRPSVIKIDVEGAEMEVLQGAVKTLRAARPTVLLEVHGWDDESSGMVRDFFSPLEYKISLLGMRGHEAFCLAVPEERAVLANALSRKQTERVLETNRQSQ
jgi:FkbM family methyltransferase